MCVGPVDEPSPGGDWSKSADDDGARRLEAVVTTFFDDLPYTTEANVRAGSCGGARCIAFGDAEWIYVDAASVLDDAPLRRVRRLRPDGQRRMLPCALRRPRDDQVPGDPKAVTFEERALWLQFEADEPMKEPVIFSSPLRSETSQRRSCCEECFQRLSEYLDEEHLPSLDLDGDLSQRIEVAVEDPTDVAVGRSSDDELVSKSESGHGLAVQEEPGLIAPPFQCAQRCDAWPALDHTFFVLSPEEPLLDSPRPLRGLGTRLCDSEFAGRLLSGYGCSVQEELRGDVPKHWWMLNSFDMSSRISSLNHWNPFSANVSLWSCEDELDVPLASNGLEFPWASRCDSPVHAAGL